MPLRMPKLGSRLARSTAVRWQERFQIGPFECSNRRAFDAHVLTLAGRGNVAEVVLMWRSLVRSAGVPTRFTVIGDGTLNRPEFDLLRSACPGVEPTDWRCVVDDAALSAVERYATTHPLGKKLAVLMSLRPDGPMMFTDSDVLYFERARELLSCFGERPRFLLDCQASLDDRVFDTSDRDGPVNSGVLLLTRPLDWTLALERYQRVKDDPQRFTEQAMVQLALRASGGVPLDPGKCIVTVEDQFKWKDLCNPREAILRHYVSTVRHKMWNMAHRLGLDR